MERLEGHGIERVTDSGIIIPATCEGHAKTKADMFHARVLAMSDEARRAFANDLEPGMTVLVHTWHGTGDKLYSGDETEHGLLIEPNDVVCIVEDGADVEVVNKDISRDVSMKFDKPRGRRAA